MPAKFRIKKAGWLRNKYRFVLYGGNERIMAASEPFDSKPNARRGIQDLRAAAAEATVVEEEERDEKKEDSGE